LKTRNLHSPYKDMTKLDLLALFWTTWYRWMLQPCNLEVLCSNSGVLVISYPHWGILWFFSAFLCEWTCGDVLLPNPYLITCHDTVSQATVYKLLNSKVVIKWPKALYNDQSIKLSLVILPSVLLCAGALRFYCLP
jgi:hypothetical protein